MSDEQNSTPEQPELPNQDEAGETRAPEADVSETPEAIAAEPAPLPEPDVRLLAAHDLAVAALREITAPSSIGEPAGHSVEPDGVVSLRFANTLLGYPGWFWTVSLAVVDDAEPTVLEAELLPGGDALLAPEWVPWSVRLKEYQEQQRAAAAEAKAAAEAARAARAAAGEDEEEEPDPDTSFDEFDSVELGLALDGIGVGGDAGDEDGQPDDEDDAEDESDDFSEDGSSYLHAGDVDGVDIDELDGAADDGSDEDDADEDDADEDDADEDDDAGEDDADESDEGSGEDEGAAPAER